MKEEKKQNETIVLKPIGNVLYGKYRSGFAYNVFDKNGLSPTLTNLGGGGNRQPMITDDNIYDKALNTVPKDSNIRIRKLTPRECYRLMGFDDESFSRAEKVNSNSQLYKQAGNSIVVNVLEAIFKQML